MFTHQKEVQIAVQMCQIYYAIDYHVSKNSSVIEHDKKMSETDIFVWAKTYLQSKQNFYMFVQNRGKLLGPQDGAISMYTMRSKPLRSRTFKSAYPYDIFSNFHISEIENPVKLQTQ